MKTKHLILMTAIVASIAAQAANPLTKNYKTYRQTPPFQEVKAEHIVPAMKEAIRQHQAEIDKITSNKAAPTFANTIEAYEASGQMLERVYAILGTLTNNEMTDEIMAVEEEVTPLISEHSSNISLNEKLFERVKAVYDRRESLGLDAEQMRLLEEMYLDFQESGATLEGADRDRLRELTSQLSQLTMSFGQNSLKATHAFTKNITQADDVKGLPESALAAAKAKAEKAGKEGWIFDLTAPSYSAIMKYAENRELRKEFYIEYNTRALGGEFDNSQIIRDIVNTRLALGKLFGYQDFASYQLNRKMAHDNGSVYRMLEQLREAYLPVARQEFEAVKAFAIGYEKAFIDFQPWDFSFYSNKLKTYQYDLNDEMLRPYFKLEDCKDGVFGLATRLYGITFRKNSKIQVWHPDVDAYEVFDKDGSYLGILYTDFFPREGKRAGAWMNDIHAQNCRNGKQDRPFITLTTNFTPPTADKPSLITFDELTTLLHEFGHCLHGLLSDVRYGALAGTSVPRDFVELPSQIMENWAFEKEFLDGFAKHYQTGEPIPMELVRKVKDAANFNVAYGCVRQLSFGYLDMAYHTITEPFSGDIAAFEHQAEKCVELQAMPEQCAMSTSFTHLFSGGYAAGYYGYKWAEILAADAYEHYTEKAVFDTDRAASFRENILSKGNTSDALELYRRYRGQDATIDALLRQNGIK